VALFALLAELGFVVIVLLVTVDTAATGLVVVLVDMAAGAGQTGMQAQQGKAAHAVIKAHFFPACLPVALVALLPLGAAMRVVIGMTAVAACGAFQVNGAAKMTGLAGQLGVLAAEGEFGVHVVVEAHICPALVIMAILALGTVAAAVYVIAAVTTIAGVADNLFHIRIRVTTLAAQLGVGAQQVEIGILVVVEVHAGPFRIIVTKRAILSALSAVHVVQAVTVVALLGCVLEALRRVAGCATGLQVLPAQGKIRAVVIKCLLGPAGVVVAVATGFTKGAAVDVVILVTVDTLRGRFAPGFVSLVAAAAGRKAVGAGQGEIGESVVEAVNIE
jgi:hypothetical protein